MVEGYIHSTESFGSADGPGVRFLIFVSGCRMRCRYCHNADTWQMKKGTLMTADELLDQAERYRSYWRPKGGITVSGGEPLLQPDFLLDLFRKAKARGINTCIDTALEPFTTQEPFFHTFERLMEVTDLLLADIKQIDPKRHTALTGKPNDNILACLEYLSRIGKPVWIRHVLVPGWTDDDGYLRRTAQFISTLHNVEKIEVLPYHSLGAYKWEELGIPYTLKETASPSPERVKEAEAILRGER